MSKRSKTQARVVITLDVEIDSDVIRPPAFDAVDVLRPMMTSFIQHQDEDLLDFLESEGVQINSAGYEVTK
jgi:hypothetical protein